ncbi:MAG: CRISPR system precrRNA processing endoribonuclease RAMP protein Cas6 [Synergistaceae bacterium]|nr:CRISPR system precrRNA processing endoribonuclease RAMP protein Cas6 [Synergistaceae bacterium]
MISSLFHCQSLTTGHVPISSGYLLFSALSRYLGDSPEGRILHAEDEGRIFTLSPMMPDYFWTTYRCAPKNGNIFFEKGASFAFRASFSDADVFHGFASGVVGAALTIDGAGFRVLKASRPGENEMSRQISVEELNSIPPSLDVFVNFVLPTGFKSNDRQITFPAPEIFFGSLAIRLQKIVKAEAFADNTILRRVLVEDHFLSSVAVRLKNNQIFRGCVGKVHYSLGALSEPERGSLSRLAALAPFCGVGYKVTQGMGLVDIRF